MTRSVIVYDDFYSDPVQIREGILAEGFEKPQRANYPGRNSRVQYQVENCLEIFSDLIGENVKPARNSHFGGFRIQHAGDVGKQFIHVDLPSMETRWAAVCYLSLPEHYGTTPAGTSFWRHLRTGMEEMPYDTEWLDSIGISGPDDLFQFMNTEGTDPALWEKTWELPIKFNRLVIFRSNMWHSQGELFGTDDTNGRLIQTFFFEPDNL